MSDNPDDRAKLAADVMADGATKKTNYEEFINEASEILRNSRRTDYFVVVYLDIAGFQLVNDFYGFEEGDRLLLALETYLQTLPYTRVYGRVFSDHYLHLLYIDDGTDIENVRGQYEESLETFLRRERINHARCNIFLAGGLCRIKGKEESLIAAVDNANIARKMAKDFKKTRLLLFDTKLEEQIHASKVLEIGIQEALQKQEFTIFLQPKVNLSNGKIVGYEALSRWIRQDKTMVSPSVFIPVMEKNGTIVDFDYTVYRKVCQYLKSLLDMGKPALPISANMSREHIRHADTAERIHRLVQEYEIPPYLLEFELTESMLMEDFSVAKQIMQSLRRYGYRTSIDDYGSGYSGVMVFQELDFDVLKLDRRFLDADPEKVIRNDAIVRGIAPLAKEMQVTLLCEGIETLKQCERMRELGCGVAQGYYFSEPLPIKDFEDSAETDRKISLRGIVEQDAPSWMSGQGSIELLSDEKSHFITQALLHIAPCEIAGFDENMEKVLFATPGFFQLLGYSKEKMEQDEAGGWSIRKNTEYVIYPDHENIQKSFNENKSVRVEFYVTGKDKNRTWISMYAGRSSSMRWGTYVLGALFDDTDKKKAQNQADEYQDLINIENLRSNQRMRTMAELLGASVLGFDFEKKLMFLPFDGDDLNTEDGGFHTMPLEDFLAIGMVHPDYTAGFQELLKNLEKQDEASMEFPYKIGEDQYHWVLFRAQVAVREEEKPLQCICVLRFIGKMDEYEAEKRSFTERKNGRIRKVKNLHVKRPLIILIFCLLFVSVAIYMIFIKSRKSLETEFYQMASENMDAYTEAQRLEVNAYMQNVDGTLRAILALSESASIDPDSDYFQEYLKKWSENNDCTITYIPIESLKVDPEDPEVRASDIRVAEELKQGKTILSDIRYSKRLGGDYFSLALPVNRNGKIEGALRSTVNAEKLLETKQSMVQNSLIASYLVKGDGSTIHMKRQSGEAAEPTLLAEIRNIFPQTQQSVYPKEIVSENSGSRTNIMGHKDGTMTFMSTIYLGYNDWYIVNFTKANRLEDHTRVVVKNSVESSMLLIAMSILVGLAIYYVYNLQRRRLRYESERYSILSEFSDTVLFQYFYETDTMELTPNVKESFQATALHKEHYLLEDVPVMAIHEEGWPLFRSALEHAMPKDETMQLDFRIRDKKGKYVWCSAQIRYLYGDDTAIAAVGKITNIHARKKLEETLLKKTRLDSLTQILNKSTVEQRVAELLERDKKGILIMLDMDDFKMLNDVYGHILGDEALRQTGKVLREVFRKSDVVGRIGGDEFIVFLPNTTEYALAEERIQKIFQRLCDISKQKNVEITVSVGIAVAPKDGTSYPELYVAADQAMYQAKQKGKNQYYFES